MCIYIFSRAAAVLFTRHAAPPVFYMYIFNYNDTSSEVTYMCGWPLDLIENNDKN